MRKYKPKQVEVENKELALRNSNGDIAIIPVKYRDQVQSMMANEDYAGIDQLVSTLPKVADKAQQGTVVGNPPQNRTDSLANVFLDRKEQERKKNMEKGEAIVLDRKNVDVSSGIKSVVEDNAGTALTVGGTYSAFLAGKHGVDAYRRNQFGQSATSLERQWRKTAALGVGSPTAPEAMNKAYKDFIKGNQQYSKLPKEEFIKAYQKATEQTKNITGKQIATQVKSAENQAIMKQYLDSKLMPKAPPPPATTPPVAAPTTATTAPVKSMTTGAPFAAKPLPQNASQLNRFKAVQQTVNSATPIKRAYVSPGMTQYTPAKGTYANYGKLEKEIKGKQTNKMSINPKIFGDAVAINLALEGYKNYNQIVKTLYGGGDDGEKAPFDMMLDDKGNEIPYKNKQQIDKNMLYGTRQKGEKIQRKSARTYKK